MKLEDLRDEGAFSLWLSLEALSGKNSADTYSLDVMRLNFDWNISDSLRMTIGRQSFLTGYGYGWNPMDLVNPLKDPSDPEQERAGTDALTLLLDRGGDVQSEAYILLQDGDENSLEYKDVKGGAGFTFLLPFAELKLSAQAGKDSALSAGFLTDIQGAGLYGEAVLRERNRLAPADDDPVYSALAGLEYVFLSELSFTMEYFYNGEGMDQEEREDYTEALEAVAAAEDVLPYWELYIPGFFSRHYLLLNLFYPVYPLWSELNCSVIVSPDGATLAVQPEWVILPNGSLEIALGWSGIYSLDDERYGEATLSPVNNSAYLKAVYHF
jgi:hypothetical protein